MENIMTFVAEPNETVRGDRVYKQMSDGTIRVEPTKIFPGNQFGDYVVIKGEPTEEEIESAKKTLVEQMCGMIRDLAATNEKFFIVKEESDGDGISVAYKFILPTL